MVLCGVRNVNVLSARINFVYGRRKRGGRRFERRKIESGFAPKKKGDRENTRRRKHATNIFGIKTTT
jgi:hypothetical protein